MPLRTVHVPKEMEPLFAQAEQAVARYFADLKADPARGTIEIFGERYVLVRAAALSIEFFALVEGLFGDERRDEAHQFARNILYDLAHAIGKSDARLFQEKMDLHEPLERLSAGPVHFSHSGWAFVDIFPESRPSADENYMIVYDHPYSFEADAWLRRERTADFPVCIMNAGYSSGWCEESFDVTLVASEILCRAKGDEACRFIMAPPDRIAGHIAQYVEQEPTLAASIRRHQIPDFFERKRIEEELRQREEQYRGIFEASTDGLAILDLAGVIVDVNPAACAMYGYGRDEMIGMKGKDLIHPDHRYRIEEFKKEVRTQGRFRAEKVDVRKDGTPFDVEVHGTRFRYRGRRHVLIVTRDITERKRAEQRLEQTLAELERSNADLEQFAYAASHDLQEPLRLVASYLGLLERRCRSALDAKAHELIDEAVGASGRMGTLIDDLLAYSRVGTAGISVQPADTARVVDAVLANLEVAVREAGATVTAENLPTVRADQGQLVQLFQNLIGNAVKFRGDAPPRVRIVAERRGGQWLFGVSDNGIGIAPEHLERIFLIFQRLHTRSEYPGTGVGLAVCKRIVERHGGRIWVESEPGQGTTFLFTIPDPVEMPT